MFTTGKVLKTFGAQLAPNLVHLSHFPTRHSSMAARDVGGTAPVCPFQIMASGGHALACASGTGQPASEAKGYRPVGSQGSVTLVTIPGR